MTSLSRRRLVLGGLSVTALAACGRAEPPVRDGAPVRDDPNAPVPPTDPRIEELERQVQDLKKQNTDLQVRPFRRAAPPSPRRVASLWSCSIRPIPPFKYGTRKLVGCKKPSGNVRRAWSVSKIQNRAKMIP